MTTEEISIISDAVRNALCWGTGILTACQEALEDAGFEWTEKHEAYVFKMHIEGDHHDKKTV